MYTTHALLWPCYSKARMQQAEIRSHLLGEGKIGAEKPFSWKSG